jgi:hypothetical protein
MPTLEYQIKQKVKKVLAKYGDELDALWIVPSGMGSPTLDCIICYRGHHIEVETKAPGKTMTPRQIITAEKKEKAGAKVFCIDGDVGCARLDEYLNKIKSADRKIGQLRENNSDKIKSLEGGSC